MSKSWWTARDIADAKLPGLPGNRANASEWIGRVRARAPELVRRRVGRGAGFEVSIDALPLEARTEMERRSRVIRAAADAQARAHVEQQQERERQVALTTPADLTGRQRLVMEARATILQEVDRRCMLSGLGRKAVVLALVDEIRSGKADQALVEAAEAAKDKLGSRDRAERKRKGLGRSTIFEWFAAREAGGVPALAPGARKAEPVPGWFMEFMHFYARPSKPAVTEALHLYGQALGDPSKVPTEKQVRYALSKLTDVERSVGREGQLKLRSKMAYVARDASELLPTSVYIADGKTFDAEVAHPIHGQPFRPELTSILDVATRRCVGWSAALDESTFAVVDALRRACGGAGIPAIFYTDRGPGYRNEAMDAPLTGFLARAGITAMRALPYNSQAKGVVERFNHVWNRTARELPTYIGKPMDPEAKKLVFRTTRRDVELTGSSRLLPGWGAFLEAVAATVAQYNDAPHAALPKIRDPQTGKVRHQSPNEAWAERTKLFDPIIPTRDELDDMFRPYVVRTTRRALVEWLGNSYFAPELERHHGEQVVVGYEVQDPTKVWVRAIDEVDGARVPGRLIAVAVYEGNKTRYVPLSAERKAMETRAAGRRRRLQVALDEVEQELRPAALLEHIQQPSLDLGPIIQATALPEAEILVPADPNARPVFSSEAEFARWALANPGLLGERDRALLRDALSDGTSRSLLRACGLNLDQLGDLAA